MIHLTSPFSELLLSRKAAPKAVADVCVICENIMKVNMGKTITTIIVLMFILLQFTLSYGVNIDISSKSLLSPRTSLQNEEEIVVAHRNIYPIEIDKEVLSVMLEAWLQLAKIGDLDTLKNMDRFDFAQKLGAKEINNDNKHLCIFYISAEEWNKISKDREKLARGERELPRKHEDQAILLCSEIDGPGIYYNRTVIERQDGIEGYHAVNKATFAHEYFERAIYEAGLVDEDCFRMLGHTHIAILVGQLCFASIIGFKEISETVPVLHDDGQRLFHLRDPHDTRAWKLYKLLDEVSSKIQWKGYSWFEIKTMELWNKIGSIISRQKLTTDKAV